jgi:hypothetical protein
LIIGEGLIPSREKVGMGESLGNMAKFVFSLVEIGGVAKRFFPEQPVYFIM